MAEVPDLSPGQIVSRVRKTMTIVDPELRPDEQVLWARRANRYQNRWRAVGGRIYVTDRRLVFARSELEAELGGAEWSCDLADVLSAEKRGPLRRVHVTLADGTTEHLVLPEPDRSAAVIADAAKAAREATDGSV